ncbi:uncharacterized protein [Porites lutea]|uniref:uncharacterized protein isoform X2 n=1 Tax=Porites lutea TaxID=51062 RepID=UPI003CC567C4
MVFKLFILCIGLFSLTVSASSLRKGGLEKKDSTAKYTIRMSVNGTEFDVEVEVDKVDKEKDTETFHLPKISPDMASGDVIYDFKKNLTMFRVTEAKACYLRKSTRDARKRSDLQQLLEVATRNGLKVVPQTVVKLKVVSTIDDRSDLSDEMANLCAKLPIYEVDEGELDLTHLNQETRVARRPANRVKRGICDWVCSVVCGVVCNLICDPYGCNEVCSPVCDTICDLLC